VKDSSLVNEALAKRLGASGVIRLNKTGVQVIVGFAAEKIANAMKTAGDVPAAGAAAPAAASAKPQAVPNVSAAVIAELVSPVTGRSFLWMKCRMKRLPAKPLAMA
jgi:PTS system N-acetylglucosamine-specific IIC component